MIELVEANIEEFNIVVYPEYCSIFSEPERKSYKSIIKSLKNGISKTFKILDGEEFVGFIIINELNQYLVLDYLAILPKYQSRGYGHKAIELLVKYCNNKYYGIFVEVECDIYEKDLNQRERKTRRLKFYESLGFKRLKYDLSLNSIIYHSFWINTSNIHIEDETILKNIFKVYELISGKETVKEKCKMLEGRD